MESSNFSHSSASILATLYVLANSGYGYTPSVVGEAVPIPPIPGLEGKYLRRFGTLKKGGKRNTGGGSSYGEDKDFSFQIVWQEGFPVIDDELLDYARDLNVYDKVQTYLMFMDEELEEHYKFGNGDLDQHFEDQIAIGVSRIFEEAEDERRGYRHHSGGSTRAARAAAYFVRSRRRPVALVRIAKQELSDRWKLMRTISYRSRDYVSIALYGEGRVIMCGGPSAVESISATGSVVLHTNFLTDQGAGYESNFSSLFNPPPVDVSVDGDLVPVRLPGMPNMVWIPKGSREWTDYFKKKKVHPLLRYIGATRGKYVRERPRYETPPVNVELFGAGGFKFPDMTEKQTVEAKTVSVVHSVNALKKPIPDVSCRESALAINMLEDFLSSGEARRGDSVDTLVLKSLTDPPNPRAAVGVPTMNNACSVSDCIKLAGGPGAVQALAQQRIDEINAYPSEAWNSLCELSTEQLFERGLVRPIDVFEKYEPHSPAKVTEGRFRVLGIPDIVDRTVIQHVTLALQDYFGSNSVLFRIASFDEIAPPFLSRVFDGFSGGPESLASACGFDFKAFDATKVGPYYRAAQSLISRIAVSRCGVPNGYAAAYERLTHMYSQHQVFVVGSLVFAHDVGGQISGSPDTTCSNLVMNMLSRCLALVSHYGISSVESPAYKLFSRDLLIVSNGDDSVCSALTLPTGEPQSPADYASLVNRLTPLTLEATALEFSGRTLVEPTPGLVVGQFNITAKHVAAVANMRVENFAQAMQSYHLEGAFSVGEFASKFYGELNRVATVLCVDVSGIPARVASKIDEWNEQLEVDGRKPLKGGNARPLSIVAPTYEAAVEPAHSPYWLYIAALKLYMLFVVVASVFFKPVVRGLALVCGVDSEAQLAADLTTAHNVADNAVALYAVLKDQTCPKPVVWHCAFEVVDGSAPVANEHLIESLVMRDGLSYSPGTAPLFVGLTGMVDKFVNMYGKRASINKPTPRRVNNGNRVEIGKGFVNTEFGMYADIGPVTAYANCVLDPTNAPVAGIPIGPTPGHTATFRSTITGTLETGLNGAGFVQICPALSNDFAAGLTAAATLNTFVPSTFGVDPVAAAGAITVQSAGAQLPYTSAQVGITANMASNNGGILARLVAARLTVRNTTPVINRGGRMWLVDSTASSTRGMTVATLAAMVANGMAFSATNDSDEDICIDWSPKTWKDYQFVQGVPTSAAACLPDSITKGGINTGNTMPLQDAPLMFCIQAPSLSGAYLAQTFEWEYTCIVEYTGFIAVGLPPNYGPSGTFVREAVTRMVHTAVRTARQRTKNHGVSSTAPRKEVQKLLDETDEGGFWEDAMNGAKSVAKAAWNNRQTILEIAQAVAALRTGKPASAPSKGPRFTAPAPVTFKDKMGDTVTVSANRRK